MVSEALSFGVEVVEDEDDKERRRDHIK